MTLGRIEFHRKGQGPGCIVVTPETWDFEFTRLAMDPAVDIKGGTVFRST